MDWTSGFCLTRRSFLCKQGVVMNPWRKENFNVLFTEEEIAARIKELGRQISRDYENIKEPLLVIGMLRGSLYFIADLTRAIDLPLTFDFIGISGFDPNGGLSSMSITKDLVVNIKDRHVLVLEEIIRTGLTTSYMMQFLEDRKPASLTLAAFLASEDQLLIDLPLKYTGFEIDYTRVVGYGMDFQDKARNLPYVVQLEKEKLLKLF